MTMSNAQAVGFALIPCALNGQAIGVRNLALDGMVTRVQNLRIALYADVLATAAGATGAGVLYGADIHPAFKCGYVFATILATGMSILAANKLCKHTSALQQAINSAPLREDVINNLV